MVTPLFTKKTGEQSVINPQSLLETREDTTMDSNKKRQFEESSTNIDINKVSSADASSNTSTNLDNQDHFRNQLEPICSSRTSHSAKVNIITNVLKSNKNNMQVPNCFHIANLNVSTEEETLNSNGNVEEIATGVIRNNILNYNYSSNKFQTSVNNNENTNLDFTGQKRKRNRTKKYVNKFPFGDTLTLPIYDLRKKSNDAKDYVVDCVEVEASEQMVDAEAKKAIAFKETHFSELIQQQPIMDIQPKEGDVIKFKVHKLSDLHGSEVSSIIVGKVVTFNPESLEVIWNIIYGQDQCFQSQLKSCALEGGSNNIQFHCKWSDLLDPRLLP